MLFVDPISEEIGKTIAFCVSQNHAAKITQILNEFADKLFPGKYHRILLYRLLRGYQMHNSTRLILRTIG